MAISTERALHLIEYIYTAVLVFDSRLRLTEINAAGENLLSLSERKIAGLGAFEILPDSPHFAEAIRRAAAGGQPSAEWGVDLQLNHGRTVTVDLRITPLADDDGCREIIVELVDSHSVAKARREENISALHEVARKSLRGVAHEIKNPLGGLRGAAQLLERELNGNDLTEYTHIIINEADRLRNLVDRMLAPNGRQQLSRVNIHEVLEYVCSVSEAESTFDLRIERDYDPSLPALTADREQLIQAMMNILQNAVQAINGSGGIWVRTRIKRRSTIRGRYCKLAVQIEIIDDGYGVAEDIEQTMFYPMVTSRAEGTGLGLSIAQSLVQSHGGSIEHERSDDRTIFRINLPLEQ